MLFASILSTLFPGLLVLPLTMSLPTPTTPGHALRGLTFSKDIAARSDWWENNMWRRDDRFFRAVAPSQPVRPSQPVPSASSRAAKEREAKQPVPSDLPLGSSNDLARCPASSIACPTVPTTLDLVTDDIEWECVSPEEDLYSCGGCATLGTGSDCTALPGVLSVSCQIGVCQVHTCEDGFTLSPNGTSCVPEEPVYGTTEEASTTVSITPASLEAV